MCLCLDRSNLPIDAETQGEGVVRRVILFAERGEPGFKANAFAGCVSVCTELRLSGGWAWGWPPPPRPSCWGKPAWLQSLCRLLHCQWWFLFLWRSRSGSAESCRRRGGEGGLRRLPLGCSGGGGAAGDSGPSSLWPQILVANDRACRLLGHSSHDLIGQKLTQFFLKPDPDMVQALSEEHVEADGHAAVVFGTVVSVGLWAAGAHGRPSRP